ncbi:MULTISPECIES: TAXI family TRAP transporter solute-binding subunit [unclassified Bradyrhizobium]|uniref:TAXI family TRAP transporter solute-binding subunit n=1 Tax=unclassified Bradyrhizobium TaxID=2631580 RepID=UPI001FF99052|nr:MULTISPECIES: TAXI family TRAP transporter solute-binding subunit [unclassified Bradyrhizobium]MCK1715169.1 ABC transporter substrate-binding protein [Bradyrhizobium sp. 143]MCK1726495.1 ABC transporter substrate-binding protein [Bradyrhizobium sp. 142]
MASLAPDTARRCHNRRHHRRQLAHLSLFRKADLLDSSRRIGADGEALALTSAISGRLAASKSHIRLRVNDSSTSANAAELLAASKADLAIVRGDTGGLADARSVMLLTHGVVLIMASATVSADSLGDLRDTTIGVIGGAINRQMVDALKQVYQFDRAKVRVQDVAIADGAAALSSGQVHVLLAVVPLTEKYLTKIRQLFQQAVAKGAVPKLIEIESAGAIANVAPYYESYDIPKGTLRGAPPVPSDDLTSLHVSLFLVANKSVDADTITDLAQALVDARGVTVPMAPRWRRLAWQLKGSTI